jgi:hypothetical protein
MHFNFIRIYSWIEDGIDFHYKNDGECTLLQVTEGWSGGEADGMETRQWEDQQ